MKELKDILHGYDMIVYDGDAVNEDCKNCGNEISEIKELCTNEDGLTLYEYTDYLMDSMVQYELVCEFFPDCDNIDPSKGHFFMYDDKLITQ